MSKGALTGTRIRRIREDRGIRQAHLARSCDISPSYLNLIEHNRRAIGGALLNRLADALGVDPVALSEGAASALTSALAIAAEGRGDLVPEVARAEEFAGRFPGWARLVRDQHARLIELERVVETLNDRLTHDPFLSASLHNVLTTVTAIRATSGILASDEGIEAEWRARFHRNLYEDSQRLAEAAERLVGYLDTEGELEHSRALPQDEVSAWLEAGDWRVAALEDDPGADHGAILAAADALRSDAARSIARTYLARYANDARALPQSKLAAMVAGGISDPAAIASRHGLPLPLVCRRLAALPADTFAGGLSPGLVECDGSGTLLFRKPVRGFDPPRYGSACALWPLFGALQNPGVPIRRRLVVRGRDDVQFEAVSMASIDYPAGFDGPPVTSSVMLMTPVMQQGNAAPALAVGTSCRICPVADCPARREPSILSPVRGQDEARRL